MQFTAIFLIIFIKNWSIKSNKYIKWKLMEKKSIFFQLFAN